jgi:hypothetical protein
MTQQAPTTHVVSVQVVLSPWYTPCALPQARRVTTEQVTVPSAARTQHAPVGAGQLALAHALPSPPNVPCRLAQSVEVVFTQNPPARQQLPVAGGVQVMALQVVSFPR